MVLNAVVVIAMETCVMGVMKSKVWFFIALDKDEVIGSIVTSTFGNKTREIYLMETDIGYRRQGYANALLEKSIDRAFSSGVNEPMVMVGKNNAPEINMYESFRFQKTDTCIMYSIDSL